MENATKAMLIAAGVLMAILIMNVMIYVFSNMGNQASGLYDTFEQKDIDRYNYQFLKYENKEKLKIQDVVSIINIAKDNNEYNRMPVTVTVNGVLGNNLQNLSKAEIKDLLVGHINVNDYYTCECIYDSQLINEVQIKSVP